MMPADGVIINDQDPALAMLWFECQFVPVFGIMMECAMKCSK
jgi:hypothetical protein